MNVKLTITLILGLVFQLAQVLPGAVITSSCGPQQESCDCCMGGKSCHCAVNDTSDQTPAPTPLETSRILKIPAMKSSETRVAVEVLREANPSSTVVAIPQGRSACGYTGVRLSVAFCSFVI
ncbi:MAG: hypothetical protein Q8Q59_02705 [Luteolibacter sp.]|jgi:hypothetical protein|nr:hypothetical protein [Luteolibacter sp.]